MSYPFTGSSLDSRIASGLSTSIIIEVDNQRVGAIQKFNPSQNRPIKPVGEIGTDGHIEKVPNGPTDYKVSVTRVVFDLMRLPQAMGRAFYNIHAQRVPFDINVYDISGAALGDPTATDDSRGEYQTGASADTTGVLLLQYQDCWFKSLSTSYQSGDYLISEDAEIEITRVSTVQAPGSGSFRSISPHGASDQYEAFADKNRVGSLDAVGLARLLGSQPL